MDYCRDVLHSTRRQVEYRHTNSEISKVRVSTARMGTRRVRIANLLPEVSDGVLGTILSRYGEVRDIKVETCSRLCRYPVANDIRLAMINLAEHIPSHITMAGHIVLVPYDGNLWRVMHVMTQGTFIKRVRRDGDYRKRRPYPPLFLGRIQRLGGREIHCRPLRKKMGWRRTTNSHSLWGALCVTPGGREIWPIWRKCADRRNNAGCEVWYWTPVEPGKNGPGAKVKCGSPSAEQQGVSRE